MTVGIIDICAEITNKTGLDRRFARMAVNALCQYIKESVAAGEKVRLPNLGTFWPHFSPSRIWRNPKTGETVNVSAKSSIRFRIQPGCIVTEGTGEGMANE